MRKGALSNSSSYSNSTMFHHIYTDVYASYDFHLRAFQCFRIDRTVEHSNTHIQFHLFEWYKWVCVRFFFFLFHFIPNCSHHTIHTYICSHSSSHSICIDVDDDDDDEVSCNILNASLYLLHTWATHTRFLHLNLNLMPFELRRIIRTWNK